MCYLDASVRAQSAIWYMYSCDLEWAGRGNNGKGTLVFARRLGPKCGSIPDLARFSSRITVSSHSENLEVSQANDVAQFSSRTGCLQGIL